jgi:hypothetical protein
LIPFEGNFIHDLLRLSKLSALCSRRGTVRSKDCKKRG